MSSAPTIDAAAVRDALHYCPESGVFTWRRRLGRGAAGSVAGTLWQGKRAAQPYLYVKIGRRRYAAHRLAWLYMTGEWPHADIDHENACALDNRWRNLRLATASQNQANKPRQRNNTTGFKGVTRTVDGKFAAQIHVHGVNRWLGRFRTPEEAHSAYAKAARAAFGEFVRVA